MVGKRSRFVRTITLLAAVITALALGACGGETAHTVPAPSTPPPTELSALASETSVAAEILTSEPTLAIAVVPSPHSEATPVRIQPPGPTPTLDPYPGWSTYTNIGYGFSFRYPPGWSMETPGERREPNFVKVSRGEFTFVVGYKRASENAAITAGSAAPGNPHPAGEVPFFGQRLTKTTLEQRGKVKAVYFHDAITEVPVDDLIFSLSLIAAPGVNYNQIDAPADLQTELDQMIRSFSRSIDVESTQISTSPTPGGTTSTAGWKTYSNAVCGFTFDYPPSWTIQEEQHLVKISQGTFSLLAAFRRTSESINLGPDQIPAGESEARPGLRFFGKDLPAQVIRQQGKVKAIFYTGMTPLRISPGGGFEDLDIVVILYDFNQDYAAVDIPASIQTEAEGILSSFRSIGSPATTPTPTGDLASILNRAPDWKDTFETDANWYMLNTGATAFDLKDGKLRMLVRMPDRNDEWGVSNAPALQNFYLQGTFVSGSVCNGYDRYGLLFRAPQPDRGYVYGFSCNGSYRIYKWDGTSFVSLAEWSVSPDIKTGANQTNTMGVLAEGQTLKFYANGNLLTTLNDASFTQGQFGLFAGSGETQNLEIFVNEIAYWLR